MFLSVEPHQWLCHHFLCIFIYICNKCCYLIIEPHPLLIFYLLFSLFKLFFSILSKKKKKIFFCLLVHTCCYTSSNIFPHSLPIYLPTILYFTITLLSSFSLSYILAFFSPFCFVYIWYHFSYLIYFFPTQKLWVLSLSLSLSVLFFFITLIKVDLHPTKWL